MWSPETRYVEVGHGDVAYQVVGEGPFDVVYWAAAVQIDTVWEYGPFADRVPRVAAGGRLIVFDRRGIGASDRLPGDAVATWEDWTQDVSAVLDAVGSEQAVIVAEAEGGPIAVLFAAMQPDRVQALILANTSARYLVAEDYPIGLDQGAVDVVLAFIREAWGTHELIRTGWPSMAHDDEFISWMTRVSRAGATPRRAEAYFRYIYESLDVRQALPLVHVPTLVLHNKDNRAIPIEHGRYLADHIDGAKFVELDCADTYTFPSSWTSAVTEIAEFLTGEQPPEIDRILATVLFTDIVGSTTLAASMGDRRWRELLDIHDRAVREQVRRFRGKEINTTGDGFLVSFDGPARAIRCARAIVEAAPVEVRVGLHTGECDVRGQDLSGLAVHIAARIGALAGPGEVLVSNTVKDLVVGSGITFDDRGSHSLKGVPEEWALCAVNGA